MQRADLAQFLRLRREEVSPGDVGLPEGRRRRTAGLRREEIAHLAGISVDYYARLEQGRGPHPSTPVLAALARALRLDGDQRDHLFTLAGQPPPPPAVLRDTVRPGLLYLLDALADAAVFVTSDTGRTLAQNALARALVGDETRFPGRAAHVTRRWFTDPAGRALYPPEDHAHHGRAFVADLRATAARRHGDHDVESLVSALLAASTEFRALWERHDVVLRRADRKRILHPVVGEVDVDCEVMLTPEHGQSVVMLTPRPGTPARDRLHLLKVLGTQDMTVEPTPVGPPAGPERSA